jgi:hypothetical protein
VEVTLGPGREATDKIDDHPSTGVLGAGLETGAHRSKVAGQCGQRVCICRSHSTATQQRMHPLSFIAI